MGGNTYSNGSFDVIVYSVWSMIKLHQEHVEDLMKCIPVYQWTKENVYYYKTESEKMFKCICTYFEYLTRGFNVTTVFLRTL